MNQMFDPHMVPQVITPSCDTKDPGSTEPEVYPQHWPGGLNWRNCRPNHVPSDWYDSYRLNEHRLFQQAYHPMYAAFAPRPGGPFGPSAFPEMMGRPSWPPMHAPMHSPVYGANHNPWVRPGHGAFSEYTIPGPFGFGPAPHHAG